MSRSDIIVIVGWTSSMRQLHILLAAAAIMRTAFCLQNLVAAWKSTALHSGRSKAASGGQQRRSTVQHDLPTPQRKRRRPLLPRAKAAAGSQRRDSLGPALNQRPASAILWRGCTALTKSRML